mmetsp:Transcript_32846/g.81794  ORF Transcript_32846/g.81794 Transcript_32846/m.81794 type:complete len:204 (-) Transcript_32846:459-1070(-)
MNDERSVLVILFLCYPHLVHHGERPQNRAAQPSGVLPFWRRVDLRRRAPGRPDKKLGLEPLGEAGEAAASARQDDVAEPRVRAVLAQRLRLERAVAVAQLDAVADQLRQPAARLAHQPRREERLCDLRPLLGGEGELPPVRQLVRRLRPIGRAFDGDDAERFLELARVREVHRAARDLLQQLRRPPVERLARHVAAQQRPWVV